MSEAGQTRLEVEAGGFESLLRRLPLFQGLNPESLAAVAARLEWFSLPGGATLFRQGDEPDALYIVISGSLGAYVVGAGERPLLVGRITAGEILGEMALISGRHRTATVRAIRDCELLRFVREDFAELMATQPSAMLHLSRLVVQRLEDANSRRPARASTRTFAVLPHGPETDVADFARALAAALGRFGSAECVTRAEGQYQTTEWFHRIEAGRDFIVYQADWEPSAWTRLCLRQADGIVLAAKARHRASSFPGLDALAERRTADRRVDLVLLHEGFAPPSGSAAWLALQPVEMHHHVTGAESIARLARILTGRGMSLVLSGGGARGFAHLGIIKAMRSAGLPIDLVGGTSMGAVVGAGLAADWSDEEMRERYRRSFVATNPLGDFTLPIVALVSGRKVSRLLHGEFGAVQIEDLHRSFFCLSANLTRGEASVHRTGLLWRWLRAAVAIPGILPPVFDRGEVFVDAGAMNNLPVDVMRGLNPGTVIGVDVGADTAFTASTEEVDMPPIWRLLWSRQRKQRPNILQILLRAGTVNGGQQSLRIREQADIILKPPMQNIDMLNWRSFDQAIAAGYDYAMRRLETEIDDLRARVGLGAP
ncbi:MAG: patatin-like phospholipase family protein [Alphaproteobacteria bacterium]|nr:patatin-like phospholipase family protein [Alphaproteobacteria bacterium]